MLLIRISKEKTTIAEDLILWRQFVFWWLEQMVEMENALNYSRAGSFVSIQLSKPHKRTRIYERVQYCIM